jgi:membrane protease YdiL (CAAX protease family)
LSSTDNPQFEPQPAVTVEPNPTAPVATFSSVPPLPVVRDPVWSGWDVLLIALLTILTMIVVQLLTALGAQRLWFPHSTFVDVLQKPAPALIGQFLSYIAVAAYMIMLVEGKYHQPFWRAIRWNWRGASPWFLGLGTLTIALDLIGRYLPMPKTTPFDEFFAHPRDAYLIALFAVSFGPLMEEIFFRGFLYPVLARRIGVPWGVLLTALPFGVMHYLQYRSWAAVLIIFLVGVVLTIVRVVTKSVAASFLVHVGYNGTLMTLAALATDGFRHMEKAALTLR